MVIVDDKIIYQNEITPEKIVQIAEIALKYDTNLEIIEPFSCSLIKKADQNVFNLYSTYYEDTPIISDFHDKKAIALMLFAPIELDEKIKQELPEGISYFRFHPFGVDIVEIPHEKGDAVNKVLDYLDIDKSLSVSFGDDLGDISMFLATGTSYCMGNGKEEAKLAASEIIPPITEQGVKKTLEKYYL